MSHRAFASDLTKSTGTLVALAAALTLAVAFASPASAMSKSVFAKGDDCTVRTGVPGTDNGDGECCAKADPKDCVIILKPFPTLSRTAARFSPS